MGLLNAIAEIKNRLKDCKHAYSIMLNSAEDENEKDNGEYNPLTDKNNVYCCGNALPCYPL